MRLNWSSNAGGGAKPMFKAVGVKLAIFNGIIIACLIYLLTRDQNEMLIRFGTHMAESLTIVSRVALGALAVFGNFRIIRGYLKNQYRPKRIVPDMVFDEKESLNIDKVAEQMFRIRQEKPQLKEIFSQGMNQVDDAKEKQRHIRTVFRDSKTKMDDVVATIDETVQTICVNLNRLIKRAILWNPDDSARAARKGVVDEHRAAMKKYLDRNEEILVMCDKLISETLSYIEESDSGHDNSVSLESTTSMIKTLRAMSGASKNPFEAS